MNIHEYQAKQLLKKFRISVPNGIFGFSVEELLDKISDLMENNEKRSKIAAGGLKVIEKYNWKRIGRLYLDVYESLI